MFKMLKIKCLMSNNQDLTLAKSVTAIKIWKAMLRQLISNNFLSQANQLTVDLEWSGVSDASQLQLSSPLRTLFLDTPHCAWLQF